MAAAALLALWLSSCGGGGGTTTGDPVAQSAALTRESFTNLVKGNDDFEAAADSLTLAVSLDPNSEAAQLFLAIVEWLRFLDGTSSVGGTFYDLYLRAGYVNPNSGGSFYDFTLEGTNLGQGDVPDNAPDADELKAFLTSQYLPNLTELIDALAAVTPGFEYVVDASVGGRFFGDLAPEDQISYHLDAGDLAAIRAGLLAHRGIIQGLAAYDWDAFQADDVDSQDHPGVNPIDVVDGSYPDLGEVENAGLLASSKGSFEDAWDAYLAASAHIRSETTAQQESGVLTLGRDVFANTQERTDFLDRESAFRTQGATIVSHFSIDTPLLITVGPNGETLAPGKQPTINFFQLFAGEDLRALYFVTIIDPFTNKRVFGTTDFPLLSSAMWTLGGVLSAYGGVAPTGGDLQALGYAVRLDAPIVSAKTIDGSFADWTPGVNASQVGATPAVTSLLPCPTDYFPELGITCVDGVPDVGDIFVSVQGADLYVHLDSNPAMYLAGFFDTFELIVEGPAGTAAVTCNFAGFSSWSTDSPTLDPEYVQTVSGIEARFPTGVGGSGEHARITVRASVHNPNYDFDSERKDIFVKVR